MKLGIVIYSDHAETVWNAFRLGVFALTQRQDEVSVFLLAKGVECESLDTGDFKVTEQMRMYLDAGGIIKACGSCFEIRQKSDGTEMCPISTMADLYSIIAKSDKVVSF